MRVPFDCDLNAAQICDIFAAIKSDIFVPFKCDIFVALENAEKSGFNYRTKCSEAALYVSWERFFPNNARAASNDAVFNEWCRVVFEV